MASSEDEKTKTTGIVEAGETGPAFTSTDEPQKLASEGVQSSPAALDIEHAVVEDDPREWSRMRKVRS